MWKSGFIYDRVKIMQEKREKRSMESKAWEPSCQKQRYGFLDSFRGIVLISMIIFMPAGIWYIFSDEMGLVFQ